MERHNLAEIYAEVKLLFNKFAQMWQSWGISVQTIYEKDDEGLWLLKHGENFLRPLRISVMPDLRSKDELPWIALGSNEKVDVFRAHTDNRRYLRSYFERLTEYLVLEATQAPAIERAGLYIRKSGKHFYLSLPVEDGDFSFSFYLRRRGWTWVIRRWFNTQGWVIMDRIYRPHTENPIEMFTAIASNIGVLFL
jgi:hypothetical protein